MALPNATRTLQALLPHWQRLLQGWAADGRLTAAAQEALLLQDEPRALRRLVKRWAAGDFRDLPPVVLLSASEMPGAMGAYAISTGTIYLNQDWLAGASREQVFAVLTEELGHHLDGVVNEGDTPGDEGEYFAKLLVSGSIGAPAKATLREQTDTFLASHNDMRLVVEASIINGFNVSAQGDLGPETDVPWGDDSSVKLADGSIVFVANKDMSLISAPYGGGDLLGTGVISFINPATGLKTRSDISIGSGKTLVNGIAATPDGGFIVYGGAKESLYGSTFGGALDSFVIKYDSEGGLQLDTVFQHYSS